MPHDIPQDLQDPTITWTGIAAGPGASAQSDGGRVMQAVMFQVANYQGVAKMQRDFVATMAYETMKDNQNVSVEAAVEEAVNNLMG